MTQLDQFESAFKAAIHETFTPESISIQRVLVITDLNAYKTELLAGRVKAALKHLGEGVEWSEVGWEGYSEVRQLMGLVEDERPDLIVTYRNLGKIRARYSLGTFLDVLTQATDTPVMVLPEPSGAGEKEHSLEDMNNVMVVTDHLAGDNRLVSYGARFTQPGGRLYLAHIEDSVSFERYISAIGKIQSIDTDNARVEIEKALLKEPVDYIESARRKLKDQAVTIESVVRTGHRLQAFKDLIAEHELDLLVMNTKDEDQLAMHGLAYPLAIEIRSIPLLML
ncbi:MAG: universal stress protein [Planctomycetota bacterium]|jgi:hypothetical protein